jgi:serine/threonine protein kinase
MQLSTKLTQFVLRQALGDFGSQTVTWLQQHFTDPTKALPAAIEQANTRTWRVLELALTGDSLAGWIRQKLSSGAERGILQPLRDWLKGQGEPFLRACVTELRAAGAAGVLTPDNTGQELMAMWGVTGVANQTLVVADAQTLMTTVQADLKDTYPNLARFLAGPDVNLLPTIFSYFLRQAVLERPDLRDALNFERIAQLGDSQTQGFAALNKLLNEQGTALTEELARFGLGITNLIHNQVEMAAMLRQIHAKLPTSARFGAVSPRLSSMLRGASDARLLTELEARLNALEPSAHGPELLDAVGRLAMAVGIFPTAQQRFQQAATVAHERGASSVEAEAHYNLHRALLEQRQFAPALAALLTATRLAPEKFAPFPLDKYAPQQILGAGGFGVAFLCQHVHLDEPVVLKTLYREELERDIAEIFKEARLLRKLRHPGIIELSDCDYAGANRERPYLVMEYFAGQSLTAYLEQYGTFSVEQALALARLLAQALQAAHSRHILHRDLKPDNLLVRWEQGAWQIKVIDFGLAVAGARVLQSVVGGSTQHSILGMSLGGTFQYSAPEQLGTLPGAKIGTWSDVYAFGKTLSQALFKTTQPSKKNYRVLGEHPLADLLSDCMEQLPAERPQNFVEVLQRLGIEAEEVIEQKKTVELASPVTTELPPLPPLPPMQPFQPFQPLPPLPPLVQNPPQYVQHGHYLIHSDGTVTDTRTKLMWKRCAEGQTWDGKTCVGEAKKMTWYECMPNGKQKTWPAFAGHNDWRVPTLEELKSLVYCSSGQPKIWNDTGKQCEGDYQTPTIDQTAFPNTPVTWFWAASPYASNSSYSWFVFFSYGYVASSSRSGGGAVRLVRSGQ